MSDILPHDEEAERIVLCSIFLKPPEICALIMERKFHREMLHLNSHRLIFDAQIEQWGSTGNIEMGLVYQSIRIKGLSDQVGGMEYIGEIYSHSPTSAKVEQYLDILESLYIDRCAIRICGEAVDDFQLPHDDAGGMLNELVGKLGCVVGVKQPQRTLRTELRAALDRMEGEEADPDILKTGFTKLDNFSPIKRGNMPLITGQTKSGKSMFALSMLLNLANQGLPVAYFSLEDPLSEVTTRMIENMSLVARVNHHKSRLSTVEFERIYHAIQKLIEMPIVVRDDVFDLGSIVSTTRQLRIKYPNLAMVVVDYAQLVCVQANKKDNREQEVAKVSRGLRLLSMETSSTNQRAAVVPISQLNDSGESRESRSLQQDCTAKINIGKLDEKDSRFNSVRAISVPYQRNGEGNVYFETMFRGHLSRFDNLAEEAK